MFRDFPGQFPNTSRDRNPTSSFAPVHSLFTPTVAVFPYIPPDPVPAYFPLLSSSQHSPTKPPASPPSGPTNTLAAFCQTHPNTYSSAP